MMEPRNRNTVSLIFSIIIAMCMVLPVSLATNEHHDAFSDVQKMYYIDLGGSVQTEWSDTLDAIGIDIITYVQGKGYEVRMNDEMKSIASALPYVKKISEIPLESKISPDIAANGDDIVINLIESDTMKNTIKEMDTFVNIFQEGSTGSGYVIRGTLKDAGLLNSIASYQDVHYISPYIAPELLGEMGMQIVGGGAWAFDDDANINTPYRALGTHGAYVNQLGWTGAGVTIAVADTGLGDGTAGDAGHNDFQNRVLGGTDYSSSGWADGHGHGTHCTGLAAGNTFAGNGVTYAGFGPYYVGMGLGYDSDLYSVRIFTAGGVWDGPADYKDILYDGYAGGAQVHSNSWGSASGGAYGNADTAYDQAVRDADTGTAGNQQLITFIAAGNSGPGTNTVGSPGNGKNVITVGGVQNYAPDGTSYGNTYGNSNDPDAMYSSSSRGWTDDGRIKPDILTPGQNTLSLSSPLVTDGLFGDYDDDRYTWCTGTSQSCPTAAGGGALIYEWYDFNYGAPPTPATVKALMINTAIDIGVADIPNQNEGWGRMYLPTIMDPPAPFIIHQDPTELTTGVTDTYTFSYSNPAEPLKITLAYTDRYALSGANPSLLNQVNLELESPLGTIYHGNAFSGGWSTTGNPPATFDTNGDGYDDRNNVECVYIDTGDLEAGQYTLRIIGTNVPADCDFDGSNDQDYSLVIYNGLDVSSMGTIDLDKSTYLGEDTATVTVKDSDLDTSAAIQNVVIDVDSTTEPTGESVTCTETGASTGVFVGTLTLSATNSAGVLQVSHGDTVTATYDDADDGTGSPQTVTDTATIDSQVDPVTGLTVEWWGSTSMTWIDEDFSTAVPPAGWTEDGPAPSWAQVGTAIAGGTAPEANLHWIDTIDSWHLYAGPFDTTGISSMDLQWQSMVNDYGAGVTLTVQTSSNAVTWNNAGWSWASGGGDDPAGLKNLVVNTADVGSSTFYISWSADGNLYQIDDWYIDDVLLTSAGGSTTDDNWLNWTLSGDDGIDVSHYNIYRANNAGGPWDAGALIDTAPAGTATYFDFDKGEPDGINWWYVVRAEDMWGNEDTNVNAVPEEASGNNPPNAPINPVPADTATGIVTSPTLSVDVSDPDADTMTVRFYDASDDSQIGFQNNVASGATSSTTWNGLAESTTYSWYATAYDGEFTTQSATWSFTTIDLTPPASPTALTVEHWGTAGSVTTDRATSDYIDPGDNEGAVSSGTLVNVNDGDNDVYYAIQETESGGAPANRYSLMGWIFEVTVTGGDDVEFFVQAYHDPDVADGDDYQFSYSTDGVAYTPMLTVTATADPGTYQSFSDATLDAYSGLLYIKVQDTDRTATNNNVFSNIYIDDMYLDSTVGGGGGTDDNAVNWTASADDGAGADDVDYYNIYRSDVEAGPWDLAHIIDTEPATGAASYSYIDLLRGQADATLWWYVVRAVDLSTNEDANTVAVQEPGFVVPTAYDIPIPGGAIAGDWVFVSFPYPMSGNIEIILDDTVHGGGGTTWDVAKWYNPQTPADPWKTYRVGASTNDLATIDNTMGVWVHLDAHDGGTLSTSTTGDYSAVAVNIDLFIGWNLVSYPSASPIDADATLPVEADFIAVYNDIMPYLIEDFAVAPGAVTMSEGNAYWVHVTGSDTTWIVAP